MTIQEIKSPLKNETITVNRIIMDSWGLNKSIFNTLLVFKHHGYSTTYHQVIRKIAKLNRTMQHARVGARIIILTYVNQNLRVKK